MPRFILYINLFFRIIDNINARSGAKLNFSSRPVSASLHPNKLKLII